MKRNLFRIFILLFGISLFFSPAVYAQWGDTTKAQPALPKSSLTIVTKSGNKKFIVELASTLAQQQVGMMWRDKMKSNEGMLFDYTSNPHRASFWMENTLLSLDLIFIRADGTIANIVKNARPLDRSQLVSKGVIAAVLEIKAGESAKQNIKAGDKVIHSIFEND